MKREMCEEVDKILPVPLLRAYVSCVVILFLYLFIVSLEKKSPYFILSLGLF